MKPVVKLKIFSIGLLKFKFLMIKSRILSSLNENLLTVPALLFNLTTDDFKNNTNKHAQFKLTMHWNMYANKTFPLKSKIVSAWPGFIFKKSFWPRYGSIGGNIWRVLWLRLLPNLTSEVSKI